MSQLASLCSTIQDILIVKCGELVEEHNEKENLELQGKEEELRQEVQQVEEVEALEGEEIVEDLRAVEQEASSIIEDNSTPSDIGDLVEASSIGCENDVEVDFTQPPKFDVIDDEEDLEGVNGEKLQSVRVDFTQPPKFDLIDDEKELEEVAKQVEVEESYQKVEVIKEESKGVKLTLSKPLDTLLAKSPSNLQIEWVIISSFHFLGPYQYALLETDGQLRAICGLESRKELDVG
ncbi:hypothetical protein AHAS_Ahas11G0186900 [Arachis hypogaea]